MNNPFSMKKPAGKKVSSAQMPSGVVGLHALPLIYLNIPKSACSTIKNHLYYIEHGKYASDPLAIHSIDGLIKSKGGGAGASAHFTRVLARKHLVFTFVRHPGKRAYSCFSEKIVHISKYSFPKVREHLISDYGCDFSGIDVARYDLDIHRRNFVAYLRFVKANRLGETPLRRDAHWESQTTMIKKFENDFVIDFIGRVEDFQKHFEFVLSELKCEKMPDLNLRFNEGPTPPFTYDQILDDEVEDLLLEIYRADFMKLGYRR